MIGQMISDYRIVEKLRGGGWAWYTRPKILNSDASSP